MNEEKKRVIFSGYSYGGSIAQLQTIKYLTLCNNNNNNIIDNEVYCITFGLIDCINNENEIEKYIKERNIGNNIDFDLVFINIMNENDPLSIIYEVYYKCIF